MVRLRIIRTLRVLFEGNFWSLEEPKTANSRRRIHLGNDALESLIAHERRQLEARLKLGSAWEDNDLVFPSEIGTARRGVNVVYRSFRPLLKAAGLPQIRFHDLRHTAATLLLGDGVHPKVVSEMLGDSSVQLSQVLFTPASNSEHGLDIPTAIVDQLLVIKQIRRVRVQLLFAIEDVHPT